MMNHKIRIGVMLAALLIALTTVAHVVEQDNIYYRIDSCRAVVISGMYPYIGDVVIPETISHNGTVYPVTAIDRAAFRDCSDLTSVYIPRTVTAIGEHAFAGCTALDSVAVSDLNRWCGIDFESETANPCYHAHRLFLEGEEITDLVIPDSVSVISSFAFSGCTSINSVSIPKTAIEIGAASFSNCSSLSAINIDSANPVYDSRDSCNAIIETASGKLIAGCMNTVIPATVTAIGDNAFSGCFMLTKANIPKSVTAIGHYAFTGCTSLSSITIPGTVTSIGDAAFNGCSALTVLNIPNSVTAIGQAAFGGCSSLESISLPKSVASIGDYEFFGCTLLKEINLPNTVKSIGTAAFRGCISLDRINIPKSVTAIGQSAFRECPSLSSITVASGNPVYDSRGGCNAIIETSTGTLIAGCRSTVIPASVKAIGYAAFDGCLLLNAITVPNSVTAIGRKAFNNCPALKDVVCLFPDATLVDTSRDAFLLPSGQYSDRTLHVPSSAISTYQSLVPWSEQFGTIVENAPSTQN